MSGGEDEATGKLLHAIFAAPDPVEAADRPRVCIDPNVRTGRNQTCSGFEDIDPRGTVLTPGQEVTVYEAESGLTGTGRVTEVNQRHGIVYLAVDWRSLKCP